MKVRNVAIIIFYDDEKRILLQSRKGISKTGEEWGFFGGQVEEGETPKEAVVRETKEELDFDLKGYRYAGEYIYKKQRSKDFDFDAVSCKVFISPLEDFSKLKQKEGKGMKLFSLEEAERLKMVSEGDMGMIRKLKHIL